VHKLSRIIHQKCSPLVNVLEKCELTICGTLEERTRSGQLELGTLLADADDRFDDLTRAHRLRIAACGRALCPLGPFVNDAICVRMLPRAPPLRAAHRACNPLDTT
jgi:hypothetical protein